MPIKNKNLVLTLTSLVLMSCASSVIVNSVPSEADVILGDKAVGRTPLTVDKSALATTLKEYGYQVTLKKPGFRDTYLILPDDYGHLSVTSYLAPEEQILDKPKELKRLSGAEVLKISQKTENDLIKLLKEQLKIMSGEDSDLKLLKSMQTDYPDASLPYYLESLNHFKKGKKNEAIVAAEKALELMPTGSDYVFSLEMIKKGK